MMTVGLALLWVFRRNPIIQNRAPKNVLLSMTMGYIAQFVVAMAAVIGSVRPVSCHFVLWPSVLFIPGFGFQSVTTLLFPPWLPIVID